MWFGQYVVFFMVFCVAKLLIGGGCCAEWTMQVHTAELCFHCCSLIFVKKKPSVCLLWKH